MSCKMSKELLVLSSITQFLVMKIIFKIKKKKKCFLISKFGTNLMRPVYTNESPITNNDNFVNQFRIV